MTHSSEPVRPLDCDGAFQRLFDFLDKELDAATEQALLAHVQHCKSCFDRAEFERRFKAAVCASRKAQGCPEELRSRVMQALSAEGFGR